MTDLSYQMDPALEKEWIRQNHLIYGGLIAAGGLMLQPFLAAPSLDLTATIAVLAFSVAIPLLAALWLIGEQETFRRHAATIRAVNVTKVVAQGTAILGIVAGFWHISWMAGVGFLAAALVGVFVHAAAFVRLEWLGVRPSGGRDAAGAAKR